MPKAAANGIELEYETFGENSNAPLLLIMGLGAQMTAWPEALCRQLAARGFFVIRFDNRDVGLSTKFDSAGAPNLISLMASMQQGGTLEPPYTLWDMAADAAGLLDALGIHSAHIVGASMGGMIAQAFAIKYPQRSRSLTSIMSTTSEPDLPQASPAAMAVLMAPRPADRASAIEAAVASRKVLSGGGFPIDEAEARRVAAETYDRSNYPEGMARQLVAIVASGGRRDLLREVKVPTVVIHGDTDPLVPHAGGLDTHQSIDGAEMVTVPGMGHELPEGAWPQIIDAIERVAKRAVPA
ncbi:MAG TPA: alpha/beta hydrolase [Dehalococcoidia bacterium]